MLALLLCGPVPMLLTRAPAFRRSPRAAMVMWQSVALAAVLAALGAGLSLSTGAVLPYPSSPPHRLVAALALTLTGVVLARLLWKAHQVGRRLRAARRRHRAMVDLLSSERADVRVLEHERPTAYCLPGLRSARVVLSRGTFDSLAGAEVDAVVAHERAHLRARHDLAVEAFTVLHEAFPRGVSSAAALTEVRLLVEVLADAAARRRVGARPLARALVTLADGRAPEATLAAGGTALVERVELLAEPGGRRWPLTVAAWAVSAGVLVLPTAFIAWPWLATTLPAFSR